MAGVRSWIRGSLIGAGAYGKVNLALNRDNGELFAVKSIECSDKAESELKAIENEVQILQSLDSPYVVSCYGSDWSVENGKSMRNVFMEYMPGGSVADLMQKFAGKLDESLVRAYSRSILEGLRYLHGQGVVHGDIKGKNVLVGAKGVKLADFGAAKRIAAPGSGQHLESIKGTPHWMAPEVVMQVERGPASDIWSLGCTIVEMASGKAPWNHLPNAFSAMFHIGCTQDLPPMPASLSEEGRDFLDKCFQRDAKVRWTAQQLLAHPFITGEFCCPEPVEKVALPESPTSVMDFAGPRGWDSQSRSESDIVNSVPILALKRAGALAAPAPASSSSAEKQELEFGLGSFGCEQQAEDWWCSSPLSPKEGQWITVRSPKLPGPGPGPGPSSSASSPTSSPVDSPLSNFPRAVLDFSNIFVGAHPAPVAEQVCEAEEQEVVEATLAVACSSSSDEEAQVSEFLLPAPLEEVSHEPDTASKQAQAFSGSEACSDMRIEDCNSASSSSSSLSEACHTTKDPLGSHISTASNISITSIDEVAERRTWIRNLGLRVLSLVHQLTRACTDSQPGFFVDLLQGGCSLSRNSSQRFWAVALCILILFIISQLRWLFKTGLRTPRAPCFACVCLLSFCGVASWCLCLKFVLCHKLLSKKLRNGLVIRVVQTMWSEVDLLSHKCVSKRLRNGLGGSGRHCGMKIVLCQRLRNGFVRLSRHCGVEFVLCHKCVSKRLSLVGFEQALRSE